MDCCSRSIAVTSCVIFSVVRVSSLVASESSRLSGITVAASDLYMTSCVRISRGVEPCSVSHIHLDLLLQHLTYT